MTASARPRETTASQTPEPSQSSGKNPLLAALLALIPGVGHFYVNSRTRGVLLLFLLPLLTVLTIWRLEIAGVDPGGLLNGTQSTADFSSTATTHFGTAVVLIIMLRADLPVEHLGRLQHRQPAQPTRSSALLPAVCRRLRHRLGRDAD